MPIGRGAALALCPTVQPHSKGTGDWGAKVLLGQRGKEHVKPHNGSSSSSQEPAHRQSVLLSFHWPKQVPSPASAQQRHWSHGPASCGEGTTGWPDVEGLESEALCSLSSSHRAPPLNAVHGISAQGLALRSWNCASWSFPSFGFSSVPCYLGHQNDQASNHGLGTVSLRANEPTGVRTPTEVRGKLSSPSGCMDLGC